MVFNVILLMVKNVVDEIRGPTRCWTVGTISFYTVQNVHRNSTGFWLRRNFLVEFLDIREWKFGWYRLPSLYETHMIQNYSLPLCVKTEMIYFLMFNAKHDIYMESDYILDFWYQFWNKSLTNYHLRIFGRSVILLVYHRPNVPRNTRRNPIAFVNSISYWKMIFALNYVVVSNVNFLIYSLFNLI